MAIQVALKNKEKESATILDSSIREKYNAFIKKYSPKIRENLCEFGESGMQLTGSSPVMLVYLRNFGLLPKDARLAEREDLEIVKQKAPDFFSNIYVDCELNLVTGNGGYKINPVFAENLAKDLKKAGVDLGADKLIPYDILKPQANKKSPKGLVFRLSEEGKDTAKKRVLNTADFKWDYNPSDSGLFRAGLDWDGLWYAGIGGLADSDGDGRVVIISGKAAAQKFLNNYASEFEKDRDYNIVEINKEYEKRKASLRIE